MAAGDREAGSAAAEEQRLVGGLLTREPHAVAEFLERTHHPVYCMALRLARDPDRARDWAHQVILGVLDDLARGCFVYWRPGSFWAWFRKRAHFRLLDEYRRDRWARGSASEEVLLAVPGAEDPARDAERAELRSAIEGCLDALASVEQRRSLELLLFEDLGYQQIAEILSAPLNTVRSWIRRARLAVRRCLIERLGLARPIEPGGAASPAVEASSEVQLPDPHARS
jgi:RNA polymerase sigma-70 factor, ECF subfamily